VYAWRPLVVYLCVVVFSLYAVIFIRSCRLRSNFCSFSSLQALTLTLIQPASKWMHWPHSDAILIYFELPPPLPPRWFQSLTSPCWLCSSGLYADYVDQSWNRVTGSPGHRVSDFVRVGSGLGSNLFTYRPGIVTRFLTEQQNDVSMLWTHERMHCATSRLNERTRSVAAVYSRR